MRNPEWKKVVQPILSNGDEWSSSGSLFYRRPLSKVIRGITMESSSMDHNVYIWCVTAPLFIPCDVLELSWSKRVGNGSTRFGSSNSDELRSAVRAAVEMTALNDERALESIVAMREPRSPNRRINETVGYSHFLLGNYADAIEELALASGGEISNEWEHLVVNRATKIKRSIELENYVVAVQQLEEWCDSSSSALALS